MIKANPYLNFDGNTREAMEFYKSVFGGEFNSVMTFGEMAQPDQPVAEEEKDRIMHMSLPIGEELWIMASDISPSHGHKLTMGNNNYICLVPETKEEGQRIFDELSVGGKVEMPFEKMFWGDYFASFFDKFGVGWMINWGEKKENEK